MKDWAVAALAAAIFAVILAFQNPPHWALYGFTMVVFYQMRRR